MTLLHPKISEIYSIGTIIEANVPPGGKWLPCQGQILAQADYLDLYNMMDNPYSMIFSDWEFCDDFDTGGDYPYHERVQWNGSTGSPIWLALAGDYNYCRSTDGITWTIGSMPSTGNWKCAFGNSIFCAVKYGSTSGATSSDGSSWTSRTLNLSSNWTAVVWDGTNFVAISSNNTQTIKSTDGITWSNGGVLPETPFYYAASDGAGTIVAIDGANDIAYSINGGTTWTKVEGPMGGWYSVEYCNGYFLIATERGYVGISSDGIDWDWRPYFIDRFEGNDQEMGTESVRVFRWRYHDGIYFAPAYGYGHGVYSFDMKTFWPWFTNPSYGEQYDTVYNPTSGNLTVFGGYTYSMPYSKITGRYNSSTHFQLPLYFKHKFYEREKNRYIRVL